jgi:dienelactone hydrolase
MHFISQTVSDGVSEQHFTVGDIPGVLWMPAGASGPHPLVLVGHGGGQHKTAPGVVGRARRYVAECGFAAASIDAPSHGDRAQSEEHQRFSALIRERIAAGEPVGPLIPGYNATIAAQAVPEWRETLDALQQLDQIGAGGPVGYTGLSMGGACASPRPSHGSPRPSSASSPVTA